MRFVVVDRAWQVEKASSTADAVLVSDSWDDFGFKTTFELHVVMDTGDVVLIGGVRIARLGMGEGPARTFVGNFPRQLELLPSIYFSLGMDISYYENLNTLARTLRHPTLTALQDLALDFERFDDLIDSEDVVRTSLMRDASRVTVEGPYRRLARGESKNRPYAFSFVHQSIVSRIDGALTFDVQPDSSPATNFHALIGSNGSGKTRMIDAMWRSIADNAGSPNGKLVLADGSNDFAGVVRVSFSAFDPIAPIADQRNDIRQDYVGLQIISESVDPSSRVDPAEATVRNKSWADLTREFRASVMNCIRSSRSDRWLRAISRLNTDPILAQYDFESWINEGAVGASLAADSFDELSSGHKAVVFALTRLVELVEERTLVLLDEPESHMHPPLLSTYMNAVAELLAETNGVALAATHSPVVLQEIPRGCCSIIRRSGDYVSARRPDFATFGENVGRLTYDVFGLELAETGFHRQVQDAAEGSTTFAELLGKVGGELGSEGRALGRFLISEESIADLEDI